jgi:hypothetical protein
MWRLVVKDLGVVYLYRFAEGDAPVRTFLNTMRRHPAGVPYDLHVILKGFPDPLAVKKARSLFDGLGAHFIEMDDTGYDIGSYVKAAKVARNRHLMFLNTFSDILCDNWLAHLSRALDREGVGLAGATGSWQARTTGYEVRARQLLKRAKRKRILSDIPAGSEHKKNTTTKRRKSLRQVLRIVFAPVTFFYHLSHYPRYPNPHIRTNAFMIERALFLSLRMPSFASKENAYRFESGRHSMTRQIIQRGLKPVVVDCQGEVYEVECWNRSGTFWWNSQENLLIADNRTQDFAQGPAEFRVLLENSAWRHPRSWLDV